MALKSQPVAIACQIAEGKAWVVLVIVFFDEQEAGGESVANFLAPRDALGRGETLVDEIESSEQQERLVRLLVWSAFLKRRGADIEVVEAFDGGGE